MPVPVVRAGPVRVMVHTASMNCSAVIRRTSGPRNTYSSPTGSRSMATGTEPNIEWLTGTGLPTDGGLRCAPSLFVDGTDCVVGAGDVVCLPHPLAPETVRIEHWASTRHQAARAVENLLAGRDRARPLTALPEFGTRIHGARIRGVGFPQVADGAGVVWGSLRGGSAVVALTRGGTSVALVSVNADRVLRALTPELWPDCAVDQDPAELVAS